MTCQALEGWLNSAGYLEKPPEAPKELPRPPPRRSSFLEEPRYQALAEERRAAQSRLRQDLNGLKEPRNSAPPEIRWHQARCET